MALRCVGGEGSAGILLGAVPSVARGALMAATQLSSYDHSKHVLKRKMGWHEGTALHVCCSLGPMSHSYATASIIGTAGGGSTATCGGRGSVSTRSVWPDELPPAEEPPETPAGPAGLAVELPVG